MNAQNPNYLEVGKEDLDGRNIYSIFEHNEELFVSTNHGIFRQHGGRFIRVKTENDETISLFDLKEDRLGKLYCKSFSGIIYVYENGKFIEYFKLNTDLYTSNFGFFFNESNDLIIVGNGVYIVSHDNNSLGSTKNILPQYANYPSNFSHQLADSSIFISCIYYNSDSCQSVKLSGTKIQHYGIPDKVINDKFLFEYNDSWVVLSKIGSAQMSSNITLAFKPYLNENYYQLTNNLFLGLGEKSGLRFYEFANDTFKIKYNYYTKQFFSCVYMDKNNLLYLGTFGQGIRVVPNIHQTTITTEENITSLAKNANSNPVITTRQGYIYELQDTLKLLEKSIHTLDYILYSGLEWGDSIQKKHKILYYTLGTSLGALKDYCRVDSTLLLFANHYSIGAISSSQKNQALLQDFKKKSKTDSYVYKIEKRYYAITHDPFKNQIYISDGENILNINSNKRIYINNESVKCSHLTYCEEFLISGSKSDGVKFFKNEELVFELTTNNGLISNTVKKITANESFLFILSDEGLQVADLQKRRIYNLTAEQGISNEIIIDYQLIDKDLWIANENKFYQIPFDSIIKHQSTVKFYLDSIYVNDVSINTYIKDFKANQNKFVFKFICNDLVKKQDIFYTYNLKGLKNESQQLSGKEPIISFDYLPPGEYELNVKLHFNNTVQDTFVYSFQIHPPYYQKTWFLLTLFCSFLLLTFVFIRWRLLRIQEKSRQRIEKEILAKNLLESELKALRSQMNPHFIFNALNSIQSLVLKKQTNKSYDYITMFADLVRNTLAYSEKEFIPFRKELEFIKVYLNLEKLRFKEDFNYQIKSSIKDEIEIPSLLIQPFIENALKHGLLHKKGEKKLEIFFDLSDKLTCRISDNGIGRNAAKSLTLFNDHESFSLAAIEKRLEILSRKYQSEFKFKIIDEHEDSGTTIIINLPFRKKVIHE